ncbi:MULTISPECIES: MFS transporter [unclassified Meiothermus]|uniref:MFS transporter n=1 Tax=unclassified Meiothermus TaxID=370471 RepID=UPI000D7BA2E2|nr:MULTISPECIES: MFS transporter [unclassified Meiothermus]PZA08372.1 MFS transporter [Meiothermus sp. Pnk-1]RYM36577.1 MFS transporter [Meiothermus sp. PNK-Is4]
MATQTPDSTPQAILIPPLIRRNTWLLALTQAVVGAGMQLLPALGAITVVQLLGNNTWAGIATALAGLARMLTAYPVGRLSDARGRKAGLYLGLVGAMGGAGLTGWAVAASSFWLFVAGILVFGAGVGATQQLRVAAADMYPPARRSEGISLVLMGSLVGAGLSPILVWLAQRLGPEVGQSPLSLAWLLVPPFILPALLLLSRLRPDPKQIARHLHLYYPTLPAASVVGKGKASSRPALNAATWTGVAAQGQMVMLMAMTSLALRHQGCSFELISLSVAVHVMGMFGLSWFVGKLADTHGRKPVMLGGLVLSGLGAVLVATSAEYAVITLGTFLVGLGWSGAYVGATTVVSDVTAPDERGQAVGRLDLWSNGAGAILPILAGFLVEGVGIWAIGLAGVTILLYPLWLTLRLVEDQPGVYSS